MTEYKLKTETIQNWGGEESAEIPTEAVHVNVEYSQVEGRNPGMYQATIFYLVPVA